MSGGASGASNVLTHGQTFKRLRLGCIVGQSCARATSTTAMQHFNHEMKSIMMQSVDTHAHVQGVSGSVGIQRCLEEADNDVNLFLLQSSRPKVDGTLGILVPIIAHVVPKLLVVINILVQ